MKRGIKTMRRVEKRKRCRMKMRKRLAGEEREYIELVVRGGR